MIDDRWQMIDGALETFCRCVEIKFFFKNWSILKVSKRGLFTTKLQKFCRLNFKKILKIDHSFQSSHLYMSSEKNFFIKILMGITLKYLVVWVVAKKWVHFRKSSREIPKSRSKFKKNTIFDLFWFQSTLINISDISYWTLVKSWNLLIYETTQLLPFEVLTSKN